MSASSEGSGLGKDMKPANQTGEDNGKIQRPQRTDQNTQVVDTARGSEPETRGTSGRRG
ncbi:hypothetical protein GCM10011515_14820 [Tsuneonella deserti]|uniref:Uncharacterized protein n=1 Tax=Tsuneonella deserti TaxID=2035528 RepID=A0ABQ1S8Y1_9SPHN|nr:hypothetical protein [Tsuneonella deserti]GGD95922.1 hypothetical protein GCM10011515_14820 [Tsuneonella deserti]